MVRHLPLLPASSKFLVHIAVVLDRLLRFMTSRDCCPADFAFYGNKLFQGTFIKIINPTATLAGVCAN